MASVGNILKEKRESLHLTLDEVAEATNLSINFLAAIEKNEFHVLPRGIFPKMFIKSYANHLGLNADDVVNLYYEQISLQEEETGPLVAAMPLPTLRKASSRGRTLMVVLILLVALAAIFYFTSPRKFFGNPDSPHPGIEASLSASARPEPPAGGENPAAPAAAAVPNAVPKTDLLPSQMEIIIQAAESCWVSFQWEQEGKSEKIEATLQPGDRFARVFDGDVRLILGNAGGVSVRLNGRETKPFGLKNEVKRLTLKPDSLGEYFSAGETTP